MSGRPQRAEDETWMRRAVALARRGAGCTSPNPMVGAVLVKAGRCIGEGWHRRAGLPHAEIEALTDAARRGFSASGATLYVTLEPCSTHGRTPPCTDALCAAGLKRVVVAAADPNPRHAGRGLVLLEKAGMPVTTGVLGDRATELNEAFNHWIVSRTPWVTVKAAMTMDGKIATETGDSKWVTGEQARAVSMRMRAESDAILIGVNTVLADDPALTIRGPMAGRRRQNPLRRIILDSRARTPVGAKVVSDADAANTTVVVTNRAASGRVRALQRHVRILEAPEDREGRVDVGWLMGVLGGEGVTRLLVEGGGEVNAAFLGAGVVRRVAFFYAPRLLGGAASRRAVGGDGAAGWEDVLRLESVRWRKVGVDLLMTARIGGASRSCGWGLSRCDNPAGEAGAAPGAR